MATRNRERIELWLDRNKQDDHEVITYIEDELKPDRAFTQTFRQAFLLIQDLQAGKTDILFKLYPWIAQSEPPAPNGNRSDIQLLVQEIQKLTTQPQASTPSTGSFNHGVDKPKFEDNDDESLIKVTEAKGSGNSSQNFLNSFMKFYGNDQQS